MHTHESLLKQIAGLGIRKTDTLLIHSSMKAVGEVERGADGVLDAFMAYMADGLLILPTHTWRQINDAYAVFNPLTEPSCVGILTNLFMKRPGVYRSLHPTHSVAACGKDAAAYVAGEERFDTPCSRGGCWGKLYDRNARILFLGCTLRSNTLLHGVEEWNNIPNRLSAGHQQLKLVMPDKTILARPLRRHDNPTCDVSEHYGKIEEALFHKGLAHRGKIGDADSILCEARGMVDLVQSFLERDPDLFQDDRPVPCDWYRHDSRGERMS